MWYLLYLMYVIWSIMCIMQYTIYNIWYYIYNTYKLLCMIYHVSNITYIYCILYMYMISQPSQPPVQQLQVLSPCKRFDFRPASSALDFRKHPPQVLIYFWDSRHGRGPKFLRAVFVWGGVLGAWKLGSNPGILTNWKNESDQLQIPTLW